MRRLTATVALVLAAAFVLHAADPYHLIKEIPIGGEGGWDYISVDPAAHRLYVSHATKVLVADIDTGKVVGEIPNTDGVHGFAVAPELGRGFSSNGRANTSTIIDLKTLKPFGTVATDGNPDAIFYEPMQKEVYTMNGNGKSATVFDAQTGKVVATIPIGNGADGGGFDPATGYAFASNGGDGTVTIAHLDNPNTLTVVQTLPSAVSGRTMILDPVSHNIYVPAAKTMPNPAGRGRPLPVPGTFKVLMFGMN